MTAADYIDHALASTQSKVFWLDDNEARPPNPPLTQNTTVDCLVVGGGFSGLWTAFHLASKDPHLKIAIIDAGAIGSGASGRNGGFVDASLTHGLENGVDRYPREIELIERLGYQNLQELADDIHKEGIDCDLEFNGTLDLAVQSWQMESLLERAKIASRFGYDVDVLDAKATQREVNSPTYLGSLHTRNRCALVNPARLAWGLAEAVEKKGVKIYEGTSASGVKPSGDRLRVSTLGSVTIEAEKVVVATNAFPSIVKGYSNFVLPVYDYVLVTEPLSKVQLDELRWRDRQGLSDSGNLFHYYRMTADHRILFGGYDAIYHFRNKVDATYNWRRKSFETLALHFFETFPYLKGLTFTHGWGGPIDTSSRFSMFFGSRYSQKLHYVGGFTGLGVGATRFAGLVLADKVLGVKDVHTELEFVRHKPLPFPPEPFRSLFVWMTRKSLIGADNNSGERNMWLRLLDSLHVGFDS